MGFFLALLILVGMNLLPEPQTNSQAALAITIVLGALSLIMSNVFVWLGWIDWSFWAVVLALWIWWMIMLVVTKSGEPIPNPLEIFRS